MVDLLRVKLSPTSVQRKSPLRREAHWGGRGELNAQENRVTVCPNIPVVSTATLVVHYLDDFGAPGRNPTPIFAIQRERSSINLQAQSCFGGVFPQPGTLG